MLDAPYTQNEARDDLRKALAAVLEEAIPPLSDEMNLFREFRLDSMSMLETLMELEDMLGFNVDPEDLDIKDFETVGGYSSFLVAIKTEA
ncbi:acyl carrier protein [Thalassococcus sp. S3]|uniref:acyl carrier protein n=1 Tax=Thalassococcus sp. S3 TaxID=2017482 RepID=UPI001024393F|nr:acyl carrier protein [Thalassococcus sp. S3]QBF29895.1 acyl carrier protein [Thalassococcus sp. S3]